MTVEKAITELKRVADLCSITPLAEAAIMGAEALKYKLEFDNNELIYKEDAIEAAINGADDWDGGSNPNRDVYIKNSIQNIGINS